MPTAQPDPEELAKLATLLRSYAQISARLDPKLYELLMRSAHLHDIYRLELLQPPRRSVLAWLFGGRP